jgi:hypothetical protein
VKFREATLTYDLPKSWLNKTAFKSANFSVVGRNLWLWSKVPYMDPDGYNYYSLAEPSYRNVGVNLKFVF